MPDETSSQPQIKIAWLIRTLVAFVLFAVIAAYSRRMTQDYPSFDQQRAADRYETLAKLRAEATKTLTTADWVDQDKRIVRIPIDEAMSKEIETLKSKPVQIGSVIVMPPPAAPATTNAPPAAPRVTNAPPATNAAPNTPATNAPTTGAPPPTPTKK